MKISDNNTPIPNGIWLTESPNGVTKITWVVINKKARVIKSNIDSFPVGMIDSNDGWHGIKFTKLSVKNYYEITSKS